MTSSLVGSEMCIRDRPRNTANSKQASKMSKQASHESSNQQHNTKTPNPVSYTHLTLPTICSV
eukprot:7618518-Prorocentrum_lima.AAC.1